MKYDYSLRHPLFYICNNDSIDTSNRYSVSLPLDWYEIASDPEWVNQYPINGEIERQGWKVHISSDFKSSHEVLNIVAGLCHDENVAFKHLSTEDKFVLRNDKLIDRGYSGKFITCYPHEYQLENFLDKLESNLSGFNGPYILSDKRWKEAPIFLRYGVFREGNIDEPYADLKIDELLVEGKVIRDSREPKFTRVEGLKNPKFIEEWLHSRNIESGSELPFKIDSAIRFSNCGGVYRARLSNENKKMILRESRPYTGLDFTGEYSVDRLLKERQALEKLRHVEGVPKVVWSGKIWENSYLGVQVMEGKSLNDWLINNFPLYANSDKDYSYLQRVVKIIVQIISILEQAHDNNVFHLDIHLGNILVDDFDNVSIIDWEQCTLENRSKVGQKMAAMGFGSWIEDYPSQIDWNGVRQVAHFLFYPLIEQSSLVLDYTVQTTKYGKKLFYSHKYSNDDIARILQIINDLDDRCTKFDDLSERKKLGCYKGNLEVKDRGEIEEIVRKLLEGLSLVKQEWENVSRSSHVFPVHYYGLNINQGIAYSDIGILMSYQKLLSLANVEPSQFYREFKQDLINDTYTKLKVNDEEKLGLFDGVAGTLWAIYELGEHDLVNNFIKDNFERLLYESTSNNLYSGKAGIFLVGLYFLSKEPRFRNKEEKIINRLVIFAEEYLSDENFLGEKTFVRQTNDPYENKGGLLYGHLGLGWLFGEAYRFTKKDIFKKCLNLSLEREFESYELDSSAGFQYRQEKRLLPYIATGSAGALLVIKRNRAFIESRFLDKIGPLESALEFNFCVFPGLFNGCSGLVLAKYFKDAAGSFVGLKEVIESLYVFLISIGKGLVLAGDGGTKITCDIASGFGGVALALASIQNNKIEFLPSID